MSYILEALKKLEQKRRREELPHLLSAQPSATAPAKKRPLWLYMIFLALLLNAGMLLWWLHPWRPAGAHLDTKASIPAETREEPRPPVPASVVATRNETPVAEEETDRGHPAGSHADKAVSGNVASPADTDNRKGRPVRFNDLPLSVKQNLPDLTISGHFFDGNSAARIVTIDGKILHEGQTVAPGLKLERITQDGVVLSYEGQRFSKGLF